MEIVQTTLAVVMTQRYLLPCEENRSTMPHHATSTAATTSSARAKMVRSVGVDLFDQKLDSNNSIVNQKVKNWYSTETYRFSYSISLPGTWYRYCNGSFSQMHTLFPFFDGFSYPFFNIFRNFKRRDVDDCIVLFKTTEHTPQRLVLCVSLWQSYAPTNEQHNRTKHIKTVVLSSH